MKCMKKWMLSKVFLRLLLLFVTSKEIAVIVSNKGNKSWDNVRNEPIFYTWVHPNGSFEQSSTQLQRMMQQQHVSLAGLLRLRLLLCVVRAGKTEGGKKVPPTPVYFSRLDTWQLLVRHLPGSPTPPPLASLASTDGFNYSPGNNLNLDVSRLHTCKVSTL